MEIAPENDAAKAKRQSILNIMRDARLTSQEKQQRIQALHTAPDHAVAATAKKSSPEPSPELPEPSSSPEPSPEDAKPPAADHAAPESAPEVDLASPPASRAHRRRARASRETETTASSAMSVTPSPKPSTNATEAIASVVAVDGPPEVMAARKRRDEIMKSATSSGRTRAGAAGGGMRIGARNSRRRSVARIGRSSFADSASVGDDDNNDDGVGKEEEGQGGDSTPLVSAASRPTRRRRRLADVRADTANTRCKNEDEFEDDRKPAAVQHMGVASASAPSPMEEEDRQQTRPGVVAVSAIDERIARKQNLGGTLNSTSATATSATEAAEQPADPVAPISSASSSGAVRVGAFSCTDLDDKIARKTAGEGRRAGAASAFSVSQSTNTINHLDDADNNINTGARSRSMMPSRTVNSLGGDGDFIPGSRSASMYTSRRQRRRRSGTGIDAGVGALATVAAVSMQATVEKPEISNITTHDDYDQNAATVTSQQQQQQQQQKKSHQESKPHHICCETCGRPYTPPESDHDDNNVKETPRVIGGTGSRRTLLTADSTEVSSRDGMALGAVYEGALNDVGENNPEQSGEWGSRHSGVLSTTGSGDWGSRGSADTYDFEDDASDAPYVTMPMKPSENEEESLDDEAKCNDEGDFRQSTISWGTAVAALNLDDMDLDSQEGTNGEEVPPPTTANVECITDDITVRRGSLEHGVQGVSEESLAVEDLEKAIADDRAFKEDLHLIKEDGAYNEDDDYYDDDEHYQYHTELQDSYNPAHQADPFHHYSVHFFADDFMEKGPATRARARRESFKDAHNYQGFVLSRDDKCNLFIGLVLIIVVTIGVSVPVTLIKKETNDAQNAPTMSPTLVRDPVYTAMLDKIVLETNVSAKVFEDDEAPQTRALQWIAYDDLAGLSADSPNLIQRYSLMSLFFGSGGSSTLLGWDNEEAESECSWFGVKCESDMRGNNNTSSSATGNVTSLDLKRTRLAGSLVSEIGSLKYLENLNLGENFLKGAIPSTLYDLSKLRSLVLEKNFFGPYLTEGVGDLSQLETLSLNDNRFESELPTTLANLKALKNLYLFSNSFSGPLIDYILDMPSLEVVDVANNIFTGTIIPSIGRLSNLRYLLMGRNSFSGTIPGEIGLLSSLEFLGLEANALQGSIPTEIGQLRKLTRLNVARSGLSSSLPSEVGNLVNLQLLDASKQSLTGEIPSTLGNLRELLKLNLMGNDLSGTIPSELGKCTSLLEIQLQRNDISGTVDEEICTLRENYFLDDLRVDCVSKIDCDVSCCTRCT